MFAWAPDIMLLRTLNMVAKNVQFFKMWVFGLIQEKPESILFYELCQIIIHNQYSEGTQS